MTTVEKIKRGVPVPLADFEKYMGTSAEILSLDCGGRIKKDGKIYRVLCSDGGKTVRIPGGKFAADAEFRRKERIMQ